jgi:aminodeoxyfutalosine synthase
MDRRDQLTDIEQKVRDGVRIDANDCIRLYASNDILATGRMANLVRERMHGDRTYYIVNRHINYTNVCVNQCDFCAFHRNEGDEGAYTMTLAEILERARSASEGITELHIVGGCHPVMPYEYHRSMLAALHAALPDVHLQAFTAVEIAHLADIEGLSTRRVLEDLQEVGLGSLPGGGAEIFAPRVREMICPKKLPGDDWLRIHKEAHELGIRTNATMLYGHIETLNERVEHLEQLRAAQDETGGFQSFIPLAFHPENTRIPQAQFTTGFDDLKNIAIGRIFLDNFPHIKSFWIMQGVKIAQVSLSFGADDLNGTVAEERITHEAGATTPEFLARDQLVGLIREAGREPVERDTVYNVVGQ